MVTRLSSGRRWIGARISRLIPSGLTSGRALALTGLGVAVIAAAVLAPSLRGGEALDVGSGPAIGSATVERRTLVQTERVDGSLDFGAARSIPAGSTGTVTWVAEQGSAVGRGDNLFSVDRHPVALLFGEVPMYRDLGLGVDPGPDVTQLEENLAELGYFTGAPDQIFSSATASALSAWQRDRGVEVTGEARRSDVVFLPGAVRVSGARVDPGAIVQPDTMVVEITSSEHVVRAQLDASQGDLARVGDTVTVWLPDGTAAPGVVSTVSETSPTDETPSGGPSGPGGSGGSGGQNAGLEAVILLEDPEVAAAYTTASVAVDFVRNTREDVLAVPVEALLAVAGGTYVLETPAGAGETSHIPVRAGMFADGWVEVSGEGLSEGTTVLVPAR